MRRLRQPRRPNRPQHPAARQARSRLESPATPLIRPGAGSSLLAGSLLLILAPTAHALTLGDINVRSALGQRLSATVPVRLGAGETLASGCVLPGQQSSDLRRVPGASVTTPEAAREGQYELSVSSESALYEPMYELELKVQCAGAPVVVRQYVLMLDLPAVVASNAAAAPRVANISTTPAASRPAAQPARAAAQPRAARPRATSSRAGAAIASGSVYRVADGDSLSAIAARVRDRTVSLWALAEAIQAANPDAFIRNDANLIKLGSEIVIPAATGTATVAASVLPEPASALAVPPSTALAITSPATTTAPELPAVTATTAENAEAVLPPADIQPAQVLPAPIQTTRTATVPAPVAQSPVTREPAVAPADNAVAGGADEANPVIAAGAGILFGLCISALLWFRGRLPSRKRQPARQESDDDSPSLTDVVAIATAVAPLVTRTTEPGFTVSYTPEYDDSLAAEFADEPKPAAVATPAKAPPVKARPVAAPAATDEITSELEGLFDGTDTTIQKRLDAEKTVAARSMQVNDRDEFDTTGFEPGSPVDFLVGELHEENPASMVAPTVEQPRPEISPTVDQPRPEIRSTSDTGTVDIHALATAATKDQQQAQTLLEALTLLERDYEEELTASQVLDPSLVRKLVASDLDPTQVSEALPRKKAR